MPKPIVFPCGGENQPACPPTPAVEKDPNLQYGTDEEGNLHVHKEGFWHKIADSIGNAIGEAKFGE